MGAAVHEVELIDVDLTPRGDEVYLFERAGEAFPLVEVSIAMRGLHGRRQVRADGPYRLAQMANSKATFRERPTGSPQTEMHLMVADQHKAEVAAGLAKLIFEINEVSGEAETDD